MAVDKKKSKQNPQAEGTIKAILSATEELLRAHIENIMELVENSEGAKVAVPIANTIDCSESQPVVTTTIRYTKTCTDKRVNKLEDPSQGVLFSPVQPRAEDPELPSGDEGETGNSVSKRIVPMGEDEGEGEEKPKRGKKKSA